MTEKIRPLYAAPFITLTEKTRAPWPPAISSPSLKERALDTVFLLAKRLQDPEWLEEVHRQSPFFLWQGALLSNSVASIALLYRYLARSFPDQHWNELAHQYLQQAALNTEQIPLERPGLFDGSSGFALVLTQFYRDEPGYQTTYEMINDHVATQVLQRVWKRRMPGVDAADYDVMTGAAGILAYLVSVSEPSILVQEAILKLIGYLMWLSEEDIPGRKNWYVPPELLPLESYREDYPDGYFNLGLSHGIPGPLAALSLAWKAGYHLPGQKEVIAELSGWLVEHQVQDQWGVNWPAAIALAQSFSPQQWQSTAPARTAWCYGTPGVATALLSAGDVLEDEALHQLAIDAIEAALDRPDEVRNIDSPTICHGVAGLLMVCLRFLQSCKSQVVQTHIPLLVQQILDYCSPELPLGVQNREQDGTRIDDPGLLNGSVGVALALLAATTDKEPEWDRCFLLS